MIILSPCPQLTPRHIPARLVLNYKNVPYKTIWLEHKDIEPTLRPMYNSSTPHHPPTQLTSLSAPLSSAPQTCLPNNSKNLLHPPNNPPPLRPRNLRPPPNRPKGRRNSPNPLPLLILHPPRPSSPKSSRSDFPLDPSLHAPDPTRPSPP